MAKKTRTGVDFFICHASEDKEDVARPLAEALSTRGFRVWYDDYALKIGDSLSRSIDRGISSCRFGIVVLSPKFFAKAWPQRELDGLVTREVTEGGKLILPVWHKVSEDDVRTHSPTLADKVAVPTSPGIDYVVSRILDTIRHRTVKTLSRWQDRPIPRYPHSIMGRWEQEIGQSVFSLLIYYQFEDWEKLDFEKVVRAIESGQCVVGLDPSVEKTIFQYFAESALSWEGCAPSTIILPDARERVHSWIHGVFTEWKFRIRTKLHGPKPSFHLNIEEERFEMFFFKGDKNFTRWALNSHQFGNLDLKIKETLMIVLPLCIPCFAVKQLAIERYFIDEKENEALGEKGVELAPSIVYVW